MTTSIDRLDDLLFKIGTGTGGGYAELIDLAADAVSEVRRKTSPQIIHEVEELEALDPDTLIQLPPNEQGEWPRAISAESLQWAMRTWNWTPLPIIVIRDGVYVRAARKALEEA